MTVKVFFCHHENDARYCDELSKHLRLLARAGLVRARREGYYVLYSVDLDRVARLSDAVLGFLVELPHNAA